MSKLDDKIAEWSKEFNAEKDGLPFRTQDEQKEKEKEFFFGKRDDDVNS